MASASTTPFGSSRPRSGPGSSGARSLSVAFLRAYRILLSPVLGGQCRFAPSCSRYAEEAIRRHGPVAGWRLALRRLVRCHPWNSGGWDPVPENLEG